MGWSSAAEKPEVVTAEVRLNTAFLDHPTGD